MVSQEMQAALLIIDGDELPNSPAMPNWESYSIESIEVLKGAAAIKKYRTVGGQGVIEIKLQE